jgi:hypothetical protein
MKTSSLIIPAAIALVLFSACEQETRERRRQDSAAQTGGNAFGYTPTQGTATDFVTDATPTPTPDVVETTPTTVETTPPPPPAVTEQRNIPYGTPVPGKQGFVTSPFAPYAGYVDVRGYPPNTEVKDPYSGKIFLVP